MTIFLKTLIFLSLSKNPSHVFYTQNLIYFTTEYIYCRKKSRCLHLKDCQNSVAIYIDHTLLLKIGEFEFLHPILDRGGSGGCNGLSSKLILRPIIQFEGFCDV